MLVKGLWHQDNPPNQAGAFKRPSSVLEAGLYCIHSRKSQVATVYLWQKHAHGLIVH